MRGEELIGCKVALGKLLKGLMKGIITNHLIHTASSKCSKGPWAGPQPTTVHLP